MTITPRNRGVFIDVMLCVNDYRNGAFTGLCSGLAIGCPLALDLQSPYLARHLRCEIDKHCVTLGLNHRYPHFGHRGWVGNWCWDQVRLTVAAATDMLNFAVLKGYHWDSIDCELLAAMKKRRRELRDGWMPDDLRRYAT